MFYPYDSQEKTNWNFHSWFNADIPGRQLPKFYKLFKANHYAGVIILSTPRLLISFCNVPVTQLVLALFDPLDHSFQWVDLSFIPHIIGGATGIAVNNECVFVAIQMSDGSSGLVAMSKTGTQSFLKLSQVRDIHSIIWNGDGLLVVDSSRNRIVRVILEDDLSGIKLEQEFWEASGAERDTLHLNSLQHFNGNLYVSMFGPKKDSWFHSDEGLIMNIDSGKTVASNIYHPHSLRTIGNHLYFLESRRGRLHKITRDGQVTVVTEHSGYLRGLEGTERVFYMASSAARRKSKSAGTWNAPLDDEKFPPSSAFYTYKTKGILHGPQIYEWNIGQYGAEVYDLHLMDGNFNLPLLNSDPILTRFARYEDAINGPDA